MVVKKNDHYFFNYDLNKKGNATKVAEKILDKLGPHEIIIHNVGGGMGIKDHFSNVDDWIKVWKFNVGNSIEINNVLVQYLVKKKLMGKITYISSISSIIGDKDIDGFVGKIPYAASKAYLNSYVKGMSKKLSSQNIFFNAVLPGIVLTKNKYWDKIRKQNPKKFKNFVKKNYPIGRICNSDEIAPLVLFLSSKLSTYISGSLIKIDGSLS